MSAKVDLQGCNQSSRVRRHGPALSVRLMLRKQRRTVEVERLVVPDRVRS
jgi:hypothetical protein